MIVPIMFLLLILVIIGTGYFAARYNQNGVILGIFLMIVVLIGFPIANVESCQKIEQHNIPLYSGSNGNEISGKIYLMGGQIETNNVVYYWVKQGNVLSRHNAPMDKSIFIEDGKNYVIVKQKVCNPEWLFISSDEKAYEFHVPEGSVNNMYIFK